MSRLLKSLLVSLSLIAVVLSSSQVPYTHYVYQVEWPATLCKLSDKNCNIRDMENYDGSDFNVHGLWPSGSEDNKCQQWGECSQTTYNQSNISDELLGWMNSNYVGVYNPSDYFRQHEFEKHGACFNYQQSVSNDEEKQNSFFGTIKTVYEQYNIMSALNKLHIKPSDSTTYSHKDIQYAIQNSFNTFGIEVQLMCNRFDGQNYLKAINLCLSKDFQPIECPCHANQICHEDQEIYIPEFQMPTRLTKKNNRANKFFEKYVKQQQGQALLQ